MRNSFFQKLVEEFNMLWFIMALGFGGTSVAGFAFLNYTIKRIPGMKGLIHLEAANGLVQNMDGSYQLVYGYLKHHIAIFGIMHLVALITTAILFILWRNQYAGKYKDILNDPSRVPIIIAPALAVGMTFNVALVGGYFYFEWVQTNMQALMPLALAAWTLIWLYTLTLAIKIQSVSLIQGFEVSKMHFGWLLVPFALGMTAVSGAGIAALGHDPTITKTAFFMSLIPFTMAVFLMSVKLFSLLISHYEKGLPQKVEFLPSFFIVVPIITLLSITLFRYGHFFEHQTESHLSPAYFALVTGGGWAIMFWYIATGLVLLKDYWTNHLFNMKYFDESQWGLICPMVAFAVLGSFVYKTLLPMPVVLWLIIGFIALDIVILATMVVRQYMKLKGATMTVQPQAAKA
jgi:hypothetical protein